MNTLASDPFTVKEMGEQIERFDEQRVEIDRRLDWIISEATTLLTPDEPFTRKTYKATLTNDSDMVRLAGASVLAIGSGGWDPSIVLTHTWQLLSGYAHARPWASLPGGTLTVPDPTPRPQNWNHYRERKG
jgi:hypothetical protein